MKRPAPERNTLHERRFTHRRRFTPKSSGSAIAAEVFMNHAGQETGTSRTQIRVRFLVRFLKVAYYFDSRTRRRRRSGPPGLL